MNFPDPGTFLGADVAHWQRFLKSRGLYGHAIDGDFDGPTQDASFAFQREQKLHEREPADDTVLEAAHSLGYEIPQSHPFGKYFDEKDGTVKVPSGVYGKLNQLAYLYYLWTDERITITSGSRTEREQAEAMYDNWYYHRNENIHYTNREAEDEIHRAYKAATDANQYRGATVDAMTSVIKDQIRHGTYLSLHLTERAVDVRTGGMADHYRFRQLAQQLGVKRLQEGDDDHLQFR